MQTKRHTGREDKEVIHVILGWTSKRNMQVNNSMQEKNNSEKLSAVLKLTCHSVKRFLDGVPLHSGTQRAHSLLSELPGLWFSHSI